MLCTLPGKMVAIHKMQVNRCRHADCHNRSSIGKKHTTTTTTTPPVTTAPTTTTSSASTSGTTTKARPTTTRTTTPATQVRFGVDLGGVLWPFMGGELTVPRTLIIIIKHNLTHVSAVPDSLVFATRRVFHEGISNYHQIAKHQYQRSLSCRAPTTSSASRSMGSQGRA